MVTSEIGRVGCEMTSFPGETLFVDTHSHRFVSDNVNYHTSGIVIWINFTSYFSTYSSFDGPLLWRRMSSPDISNLCQLDCVFNSLYRVTKKKTPKLHTTGPVEVGFPHKGPPVMRYVFPSLQWRQNESDGVSNTSLTIVYSTVCLGADQRKHQSSASLAFVRIPHTKGQ